MHVIEQGYLVLITVRSYYYYSFQQNYFVITFSGVFTTVMIARSGRGEEKRLLKSSPTG